jgi:hypothetical protein
MVDVARWQLLDVMAARTAGGASAWPVACPAQWRPPIRYGVLDLSGSPGIAVLIAGHEAVTVPPQSTPIVGTVSDSPSPSPKRRGAWYDVMGVALILASIAVLVLFV